MKKLYKNNLYRICLSLLLIISNSSCNDSGVELQLENKDMPKITATEEDKKKIFEEMAEKLKTVGSSAEEFARHCGVETSRSSIEREVMCPETAMRLREMEQEEREQEEARAKALEGAKPIGLEERKELYEKIKEAVKESLRRDEGKGDSDELDISLIEEIFISHKEDLRGALKADPYFFHLDRDCFVADKETVGMNFYIHKTYIDIVKYYMGYDPFKIIDF